MIWHSQSIPRRLLRWLRWLTLACILLVLSLAALAQWWWLPRLDTYRDTLGQTLSEYLHLPVRIDSVSALRDGWRLGLRLRGISLCDPERDAVLAHFSQAIIALDLWHSLWQQRPVLGRVRLEGVRLTLETGPDGALRLFGEGDGTGSTKNLPDMARWLFALPQLEIVGERLAVRRLDGPSLEILDLYLDLQQTERGRRFAFTAAFPAALGERFRLVVEREEAAEASQRERGTFELRADGMNLAGWPWPVALPSGRASLDLSGDWRDWQPIRFTGTLRWDEARMATEPGSASLKASLARSPQTEAQFGWQQTENGWQLRGNAQIKEGKGQAVTGPTFELARTDQGWQGNVRGLRVQDLWAWAAPWLDEAARPWWVPLEPRGELPEITFQAGSDAADYAVTTRFKGLSWRPIRDLPGLDNVGGTLIIEPTGGRLELDSRRLRVDTEKVLRGPVTLDTLAGAVTWRRSGGELRLESDGLALSNADFNARFTGSVTIPPSGEPSLEVKGRYGDLQVARVRRYLPAALMPTRAVAWLDQALLAGSITGDVVLRGVPARFPFDDGNGLFEARFRVDNAVVDYTPGWPRLEDGKLAVTFRNRALRIETEAGRLLDSVVENLVVRIDDLADAIVTVEGRAKGPGATMWQAFENSPAGRTLGEQLPDLQIDGTTTLNLDLAIPLDPRPNRINGTVGLIGNKVRLPAWDIGFDGVRGDVKFTDNDLVAENVQALWRGEPIRFGLELATGREGRRELRTRLQGRLGLRDLLGEAGAALEPSISGKAALTVALAVPTQREGRSGSPFTLEVTSDLRGVAVRLPAPLGKAAAETRPFKARLFPVASGKSAHLALEYGPAARALLALDNFPRQARFERGELRINTGVAKLPERPGLSVIAHLPHWNLAFAGLSSLKETTGSRNKPRPLTAGKNRAETTGWEFLRSVDARIDELLIGGRSFAAVHVQASPQEGGMRIDCDSEALAGSVTLPNEPTPEQPVRIALERLYIGPKAASTADKAPFSDADPRRVPPLTLTVADLRTDKVPLGQFKWVATPMVGGIKLSEVALKGEGQQIDASGEWRWVGGSQFARLAATLESRALGDVLATFGYAENGVSRGETRAELALTWQGEIADFSLDRVAGTLKLTVGPGQLRDIDPGLGRMIGMLDVQNLTRRLNFDFSDVFQPGMAFDRITGDFTLQASQAHTDNLSIEAPAARIEMHGRAGLRARDYDQIITVVPRYGAALPVAGVIAGGPVVGAAVFVAERVLQKGLERATRYRYTLKGSWDQPVLDYLPEPLISHGGGVTREN